MTALPSPCIGVYPPCPVCGRVPEALEPLETDDEQVYAYDRAGPLCVLAGRFLGWFPRPCSHFLPAAEWEMWWWSNRPPEWVRRQVAA